MSVSCVHVNRDIRAYLGTEKTAAIIVLVSFISRLLSPEEKRTINNNIIFIE